MCLRDSFSNRLHFVTAGKKEGNGLVAFVLYIQYQKLNGMVTLAYECLQHRNCKGLPAGIDHACVKIDAKTAKVDIYPHS